MQYHLYKAQFALHIYDVYVHMLHHTFMFCPTQAIVLCFRLHFTKDNITNNTAAATVRQVVTVVFERMVAEDERFKGRREGEVVAISGKKWRDLMNAFLYGVQSRIQVTYWFYGSQA